MENARKTIWVMVVVVFVASSPVLGLIEFKDGQIHNIDYVINDSVRVDYQAGGMGTTVNLLDGGEISGSLYGTGDSHLNIVGGSIGVNVSIAGSSQLNMSGGSITKDLQLWGQGPVNISGGLIGGTFDIGGGHIDLQVTISGGSILAMRCFNGQITISGGSIEGGFEVSPNTQMDIMGGAMPRYFLVGGILRIYGSDFAVDGDPFGYGTLTCIVCECPEAPGPICDLPRRLTGTLASGEPIDSYFQIGNYGGIVLVHAPSNQPPVVDAGPDQTIECACQTPGGTKVTLDGSGSYDSDGDQLTYTWTGPFVESPASGPTPTVTLLDGCVGDYEITLVVNDGELDSEPNTVVITVVDITAPTIICPEPITVEAQSPSGVPATNQEIQAFLNVASVSDKCDPSPEITDDAPVEFPLGETIVTFSATDAQNNTSSCQATVTVQDTTPPAITIVAPEPYGLYPVGDLALDFSAYDLVSGQLEPPDFLWGTLADAAGYSETVYPGEIPGAGVYTLVVSAEDEAENKATSDPIFFVVYDPSGGFVTGGGWIDSPEGAYVPDLSLTGKANFGFISKYKKGATEPTGQTEFVFHAGDLNFHSSSYDWLVVTGSDYARFKGWGSINGYGDYRFMLWAGDGPDTFRIRIWEELEFGVEDVVYDNGFDQIIDGGSIVIHTK